MKKRETLFTQQIESIKSRSEQTNAAEKQLAAQRHDLHHRYNTILSLIAGGDTKKAAEYVNSSAMHLDEMKHIQYCRNTVISATMDIYSAIAGYYNISLTTDMDIPEELPVNSEELSVVFSNALENAVNAVKSLPEDKREIQVKCINTPKLMLQVKNPVGSRVLFDKNGIPVSGEKGHGIGTRSINEYCRKNNAVCEYFIEDGSFVFRLGHMG